MGPLEEVLLILHEIIIRFEWWGIGAEELGEMKVPKKEKCSGVLEGSKYELLEFPAFSTRPGSAGMETFTRRTRSSL